MFLRKLKTVFLSSHRLHVHSKPSNPTFSLRSPTILTQALIKRLKFEIVNVAWQSLWTCEWNREIQSDIFSQGWGGGKGKGGKFVLCDAKLVGQSLENYFQPPLV